MNQPSNPAQDLLAQRAYETWGQLSLEQPDLDNGYDADLKMFTPYDVVPQWQRNIWLAVVDVVCRGAWCVECLKILQTPAGGIRMVYRNAEGHSWNQWMRTTAEITAMSGQYTVDRFETPWGDAVGVYAATVDGDTPVCERHFAERVHVGGTLR